MRWYGPPLNPLVSPFVQMADMDSALRVATTRHRVVMARATHVPAQPTAYLRHTCSRLNQIPVAKPTNAINLSRCA